MEIYKYTGDSRTFTGIIDQFERARIVRRYNALGEITVVTISPKTAPDELITPGTWLWPQGCGEVFLTDSVEVVSAKSYTQQTIKGRTASSLFERRVVTIVAMGSWNTGYIIDWLIGQETAGNRSFPGFTRSIDTNMGSLVQFTARQEPLLDTIRSLCVNDDIGFKTLLEQTARNIEFELYTGNDLTTGSGNGGIVLLDPEFEYLNEDAYTVDEKGMGNYAYIYGEWDSAAQSQKTATYDGSGGATGYGLYETPVMFDMPSRTAQFQMTGAQYTQTMVDYGRKALSRRQSVVSMTGVLRETEYMYKLGVDYTLGDRITARNNKLGVQYDGRVVAIDTDIDHGETVTKLTITK